MAELFEVYKMAVNQDGETLSVQEVLRVSKDEAKILISEGCVCPALRKEKKIINRVDDEEIVDNG